MLFHGTNLGGSNLTRLAQGIKVPLTARQAGRYMILFETHHYRQSLGSNLHSNFPALLEFLYLPILNESPYVLVSNQRLVVLED